MNKSLNNIISISHLINIGAYLAPHSTAKIELQPRLTSLPLGLERSSKAQDGVKNVKKKRTWNSRSERVYHNSYVLGKRQKQKIYDLDKTIVQLRGALRLVQEIRRNQGSTLFVLPQTDNKIKEQLKRLNQFYICEDWMGGLLTNFNLFSLRIKKKGEDYHIPKMPDAVVLLIANNSINRLVVQETYQLGIPLVALLPSHSKIPYPVASRNNSLTVLAFYRALFLQAIKMA